jgi:hypothetical protein
VAAAVAQVNTVLKLNETIFKQILSECGVVFTLFFQGNGQVKANL